jgi:hypothetical protein
VSLSRPFPPPTALLKSSAVHKARTDRSAFALFPPPTLASHRYATPFATSLARFIRSLCPESTTRVAFLCCPTGYVGFQHTNPLPETKLLEYDRRFGLFAGKNFVPYDIDEPEELPAELKGTVELAVCDPPFLNEVSSCLAAFVYLANSNYTPKLAGHQQKARAHPLPHPPPHSRPTSPPHLHLGRAPLPRHLRLSTTGSSSQE